MAYPGLNRYTQNQAASASPNVQVAIALEMAANHMAKALDAFEAGEIMERCHQTDRALTVLVGLASVLNTDTEETQKMAEILNQYYAQMIQSIGEFSIEGNKVKAQLVIESLRDMAICWRSLSEKITTKDSQPEAESNGTKVETSA